jgi:hypothetical protein
MYKKKYIKYKMKYLNLINQYGGTYKWVYKESGTIHKKFPDGNPPQPLNEGMQNYLEEKYQNWTKNPKITFTEGGLSFEEPSNYKFYRKELIRINEEDIEKYIKKIEEEEILQTRKGIRESTPKLFFNKYLIELTTLVKITLGGEPFEYPKYRYIITFGELGMVCINNLLDFLNLHPTLPVISVGSGNAILEDICSKLYKIKIFCVDPDPTSYKGKEIFLQPDYPYVDNLICEHESFIGNCVLIINWATPALDYDYEAIEKLQPMAFWVLYDESGGAGGKKFHDFIKSTSYYNIEIKLFSEKKNLFQHTTNYCILWGTKKL